MARTGAADGRTTRWHHRRPELLAAATEYVLDHGVATLTLRPLAEALGVTIATVVRQLGSKDSLVQEICDGIHQRTMREMRHDPRLRDQPPEQILRILWRQWLTPERRREFALGTELHALALRDPDRYQWFRDSVVEDWLALIEVALADSGTTRAQARTRGTLVLALMRGLHLDLMATGDTRRINQAFMAAVSLLEVRDDGRGEGPGTAARST